MEVVACNTTFVHYRLYNIYTACNYTFVFVFALAQAYVSSVNSLLHMAYSAFVLYGRRGTSTSFGKHATMHSTLWDCIVDDGDNDLQGGIQQWKLMRHGKFLKLVSILGIRQGTHIRKCVRLWHVQVLLYNIYNTYIYIIYIYTYIHTCIYISRHKQGHRCIGSRMVSIICSAMASKKDEKTFKALMKNIKYRMPPRSMKTCRRFFKARVKICVLAIVQSNMHIDNVWARWSDTYDAIALRQEVTKVRRKYPDASIAE